MSFVLTKSPANYQRLMQDCLCDLHMNICCIFIDDVIIFSKTYEKHLQRLNQVFERIREAYLNLSPGKIAFCQSRVKCVGHIVSEKDVEADPAKIDRIRTWPTPTTPGGLLVSQDIIEGLSTFSARLKPLTDLMTTPKAKKRKKRRNKNLGFGKKRKKKHTRN